MYCPARRSLCLLSLVAALATPIVNAQTPEAAPTPAPLLAAQPAPAAAAAPAPPAASPMTATSQPVPPSVAMVIPNEPRSVDPATLLPEWLTQPLSIRFRETALSEVAAWIEQETKVKVVLDRGSPEKAKILPNDPVDDELQNEPLYLLLNRLEQVGVGWWLAEGILHFSAVDDDDHLNTIQYNVGDLLDAGYVSDKLVDTIEGTVAQDSWEDSGGEGGILILGDVLFVRQTATIQHRVEGLLAALRKHGRRTLTYDPPQHSELREALQGKISAQFRDKPLASAVAELASLAKVDLRLERRSLDDAGMSERVPVSLEISEQPLRVALELLLQPLDLTWYLHDGVLWITSLERTEVEALTAVYDVRDLCRDQAEADALRAAIQSQADPGAWSVAGGLAELEFPLPGTMVVNHTERGLDEVLQLLETYRAALRASKPRARQESAKVVETRYYRMPRVVADDLEAMLPELVRPETWKTGTRPDAQGSIRKISSWAEPGSDAGNDKQPGQPIPYAVLVIQQMREVHAEIPGILRRIEKGEAILDGGGGMGGGGFGGGFFSVPAQFHSP